MDDSDGFVVAAAVMIDTLTGGIRNANDLRNISFTYLVLYIASLARRSHDQEVVN